MLTFLGLLFAHLPEVIAVFGRAFAAARLNPLAIPKLFKTESVEEAMDALKIATTREQRNAAFVELRAALNRKPTTIERVLDAADRIQAKD